MVVIAIIAGLVVPGLGQIVRGHTRRGLVVLLVVWLALALVTLTVFALPAFLVLHLAGIVDAARLSPRPIRGRYIVIALVEWIFGLAIVNGWMLAVFRVSASTSMAPTLVAGDVLAIRRGSSPERGEVVVFASPCDPQRGYVKRVVAFAGQSVEVRCHVLYLDGKPQAGDGGADFPELSATEPPGCSERELPRGRLLPEVALDAMASDPCALQRRYVVPPNMAFVLGDNRAGSHDSRAYGGVPLTYIRGRVTGVIWPLASFGKVR